MRVDTTGLPFGIYVIWHPKHSEGKAIAAKLASHFDADRFRSPVGGINVPVTFRNANMAGSDAPMSIDWDGAAATAVVVLADGAMARDISWTRYVQKQVKQAQSRGFGSRIIPVIMDADALDVCSSIQSLRWDQWTGDSECRLQRLIRDLTQEFIRMLRYLTEIPYPGVIDDLGDYMRNVNVFLSHSTHDRYGASVAKNIRDWLHNHSAVSSFFAQRDIPAGMSFDTVISRSIRDSAMAVIYTDSYSSREWCRREVIDAKRQGAPMVVIDCLQTVDERSFPYLGNVPVIRMDPTSTDAIPLVAGLLLEEVFKFYLWRHSTKFLGRSSPRVIFLDRSPEMVSLAALPDTSDDKTRMVVYPDPPLGASEMDLLSNAYGSIQLFSLTEWRVGAEA